MPVKPSASRLPALSLSNNPSAPFLAPPAFLASAASASAAAPQSATVTLRLPLGTLFDGRDYIFVTESNVRGYEWTTRETELLLDDLMDAALGNLGGAAAGTTRDDPQPDPAGPTAVADYKLSQIVVVPTGNWDPAALGLGRRYGVYDGQQRLVTLGLLLAALRDSFRCEAHGGGGKRAVALAATADEIGGMLMPAKVRKDDVARISLRRRDHVLLGRILVGDGHKGDKAGGPASNYPKLRPGERRRLLSPLSPANARIFRNFVRLSDRLAPLATRERLRLLDYVVERAHLLVCVPETSRIARNIVMSQGRGGMDNEPVDDFKGLVCFRYTEEEGDMYSTFDRWDALAGEAGRSVVSSACVLRASAALRTRVRGRGGDEVAEWERWLRRELWERNRGRPRSEGNWQGKDFFAEEVEPAALALRRFREGRWDEFASLAAIGGEGPDAGRRRGTTFARLDFLRDVASGTTAAREAEIAVLELLLRAEDDAANGGGEALPRLLDRILPAIEAQALRMALARPSPMQRHALVFALLDAMDDPDPASSGPAAAPGGPDAVESLGELVDECEFGATAGGRRLAAAMLKRMNAHVMFEERKSVSIGDEASAASVDSIQQQWRNEEEQEEWANRIGNLALLSSSAPTRSGRASKKTILNDTSWESKCKTYKEEQWPLTRQLAELDSWDTDDLQNQHKELLSFVDLVWSLESE